ncbi:hypothetical protein [Halosimplex halobium]|uniref:hypothetical protein n=1 Tax=Halosimplex halobium TaxID=3396618 RepID=UPI003F55B832
MDRDELLNNLTQDILAYAMHGAFPEQEVARSIKPDELDQRFEDYELLLDLHFILQEDVLEFVRALPKRLRSVRTETETVSKTRRGGVDGHIDWNATVKKRYTESPRDASLFVCTNRSEDYDIPENVVLKHLLSVVHTTVTEAEEYLRGEYEWVTETWRGSEPLIDELKRIVERNVHVRRIREPEVYEPTEQMLTTAETSRDVIYREAAELLRDRASLFAGDEEALHDLLDQTAITPDDDHALFELFVLFRFVATIEDIQDNDFQFKTIATGRQEIATLEGEKDIVLYHDNSAADRDLSFVSDVPEAEDRLLSRTEKVQTVARNVANSYFSDRSFRNHTGRPDVIVMEVIDEDANRNEYLIAEVKNSRRTDTIREGIKETAEYLAFLRVNDEFVFGESESEDYFGTGWNGLLVTQDLDEETASLDDQSDNEIKILQASELESRLGDVLENIV